MGIDYKKSSKLRKRIAYCYAIFGVFGVAINDGRITLHDRMTIKQQG